MDQLNRLKKFAQGGEIRKYSTGNEIVGTDLTDLEQEEYDRILQRRQNAQIRDAQFRSGFGGEDMANSGNALGDAASNFANGNWKAGVTQAVHGATQVLDKTLMGDKNFGSQSQAIDGAVHMASSALMQSGNPYAMIAGAALEGANFLTKAGGQTVQGFDVDIASSGYGDMGHMESSSSRDFSAALGPLGAIFTGVNKNKIQAKLAKRNQQALMAMSAANIADEQSFEQEARANSIQNTIMNNNIALAGGLSTSLLGG